MTEITMPKLSDSMEEGTLLGWLVGDGEELHRGDELAEIETDKATMVFEAELDGILHWGAAPGDVVAVGSVIATVDAEAQAAPAAEDTEARPEPVAGPAAPAVVPEAAAPAGPGDGARIRATPVARRIAAEANLALEGVVGTGPEGRIRKADVEAAIQDRPPAGADTITTATEVAAPAAPDARPVVTAKGEIVEIELSRVQQVSARRMAESRASVPDFALNTEVDCSELQRMREDLRPIADPLPSLNDLVVKACAVALRRHPNVNSSYRDGRLDLYGRVNVGVAVAAEHGLVVPTVFDADKLGFSQIAAEVRELATAVRDGTVKANQLSGGTFTVSNLGMYGVTGFTAVINPPQAAILAVGAIGKRMALVGEEVRNVPTMQLTLCCDHRVLDGARGAEFLATVKELLEKPLSMAL